jgi:hypothetical protein
MVLLIRSDLFFKVYCEIYTPSSRSSKFLSQAGSYGI